MTDVRVVDDATVRDDSMVNLRPIDLRARQKTRAAEDRRAHVEKIEARQLRRTVQIRFKERADRSDVLPIALKHIGKDAQIRNGNGNDMFAKIGQRVVETAN